MPSEDLTIAQAAKKYLEIIRLAKLRNTYLTYGKAIKSFFAMLLEKDVDPEVSPALDLTEDVVAEFALYLKDYAPATEQLYLQAVKDFYRFLASERLAEINLPRMELLLKRRVRKSGIRLLQSPMEDIERLLDFASDLSNLSTQGDEPTNAKLRAMRDRAFLITLADTGLRVHEACNLRRGDIDWNEGQAVIIGKGDKQAVIRFTKRSMQVLRDYLSQRAELDGGSGKPLASLPLFARHDKGAGKKVKPMTPTTGRNIVGEWVEKCLGKDMVGKITPHTFRHYFVTSVLRTTGNLRIAQELARHKNIQVTEKYTHLTNEELDKAYYDVFEKKES